MKKYLTLGIISFCLMATTVYAFNGNSRHAINHEPEVYHQNCPYQDETGNCPYHDHVTDHQDCPNYESSQQQQQQQGYHHATTSTNNYSGHGRHGRHH